MSDNDIDALLRLLSAYDFEYDSRYHAALTALVAERDALARENEAQTYEGNSVIYWSDRAKAYGKCIDAIWCVLSAAGYQPDGEKHIVDTLTALVAERDGLKQENDSLRSRCKAHQDEVLDRVFEMDALRKRVAELEAHPPADRDRELRERLVFAIWPELLRICEKTDTTGANWDLVRINARAQALLEADAMIAAMRKGEQP